MQVGDVIVVLFGAKVPYLLRRTSEGEESCKLIGEAYVHGFMDGETVLRMTQMLQTGQMRAPKVFEII